MLGMHPPFFQGVLVPLIMTNPVKSNDVCEDEEHAFIENEVTDKADEIIRRSGLNDFCDSTRKGSLLMISVIEN